ARNVAVLSWPRTVSRRKRLYPGALRRGTACDPLDDARAGLLDADRMDAWLAAHRLSLAGVRLLATRNTIVRLRPGAGRVRTDAVGHDGDGMRRCHRRVARPRRIDRGRIAHRSD